MRPTTKDLAEAAGVSLATVDRVLNDRPNVSARSRRKVTEAIERIGFVRNLAAANLARNRPYRFRFILPTAGDEYLRELLRRIEEVSTTVMHEMTNVDVVQIPMSDPHRVANYLSSLSHKDVDGVAIMAPESPPVRDSMARLHERGIRVVQFLSGQETLENFDFVGVDNFAAGATAARIIGRFLHGTVGKVAVVAETMQSLDSIQRRLGFDRVLQAQFGNLTALPSLETYGDEKRASNVIANQFRHQPGIVAVYVMSSEARVPVESVAACADLNSLTIVVHERTPFSEAALRNEDIDAAIAQNPGHAVRSALRILRARSEQREPVADQEKIRIEVLLKDNL